MKRPDLAAAVSSAPAAPGQLLPGPAPRVCRPPGVPSPHTPRPRQLPPRLSTKDRDSAPCCHRGPASAWCTGRCGLRGPRRFLTRHQAPHLRPPAPPPGARPSLRATRGPFRSSRPGLCPGHIPLLVSGPPLQELTLSWEMGCKLRKDYFIFGKLNVASQHPVRLRVRLGRSIPAPCGAGRSSRKG